MRDRGSGSKHFESRDNIGQVQRATQQPKAAHWRSEADEFASYHTDFDLQVSLELDESQGLYDDQAQCYQRPTSQQHAPRPNTQRAYNYHIQTPAPRTAARAPQPPAAAPHSLAPAQRGLGGAPREAAASAQRGAASMAPRGGPGAALRTVPANAAPLSAARSARSGIRPAASSSVAAPQGQYARGYAHPQPTAAQPRLQLSTRRPSRPLRQFVDDEPVRYPGTRKRGWFSKLVFTLLLAGAAVATRSYLEMYAAPKAVPVPVAPPPAAVVQEPSAEPAPAPEEPTPAPAPAPPLTPQERRAAARAARVAWYAERKREREEARRARAEARVIETDAPVQGKHATADADENSSSTAGAPVPARVNADADVPAPLAEPEDEAVEPAQPKRPAMADNGTLRINTRPWSVVFVDGHSVGHTPQMNLMLPAGEHEITLVNDEMQLRKSLTIQIAPGVTVTRTLNLAE